MSAHDLGIKNKVWVNRGHEPANPYLRLCRNRRHLGPAWRRRALTETCAMKFQSYWHDTRPGLCRARAQGPVEGHYDVAVDRRRLHRACRCAAARQGGRRRSSCWRRRQVGWGASGRNGGHLNNGLAHSYPGRQSSSSAWSGPIALYKALDDSIDTIEAIDRGGGDRLQFPPRRQAEARLQAAAFRCHCPQLRGCSRGGRSGHGASDGADDLKQRGRLALPRRHALEEERDDAYGPLRRGARRCGHAPRRTSSSRRQPSPQHRQERRPAQP